MPELLQVLVEAELREFVLQVYPEIHILHGMYDDIYELHTRDHKLDVEIVVLREVRHQGRESSSLRADFFEVVESR